MGKWKEIRDLLVEIADNTERAADAAVDIYNLQEEEQRDAIRRSQS